MEKCDLTRLIDRIEAPLFLACGATGAGLQARVWWGFAVGVVALAAVLLLVWSDRRVLARGPNRVWAWTIMSDRCGSCGGPQACCWRAASSPLSCARW